MTFDSSRRLSPAVAHLKPVGAVQLLQFTTLIWILPAFLFCFSFRSRNFIRPLWRHWSVSSHWSPSFSPGLFFLAACCLNTPGAAGGLTPNQSLWGTSELAAVTSSQGLFFQVFILLFFLFVCRDFWQFCITLLASLPLLIWSWKHRPRLASTFQGGPKKPLKKHFLYSWRFCPSCHDKSKDRMLIESWKLPIMLQNSSK